MLSSQLRLGLFPFPLLSLHQNISPGSRHMYPFRNKACFYCEELLAPRPTLKLEDHPLSSVPNCFFNVFAATLHIEGRSSSRNLRKRHAVVRQTHLSCEMFSVCIIFWRKCRKIEKHKSSNAWCSAESFCLHNVDNQSVWHSDTKKKTLPSFVSAASRTSQLAVL